MKTKLFSLLLLTALLPSATSADIWQDPETLVKYKYTPGESEASVTKSPNASGDITILSVFTINNQTYTVTSIGENAFKGCSDLTSVNILNSVITIGRSAFQGCSNLTSITIPNSVTAIQGAAFDGTAWYNNQPDGLIYAGKVAYKYKGTMPANTSIALLDGTLGIADDTFKNCTTLIGITIPNSVVIIGVTAFYGCSGLTSMDIPNSVNTIEKWAFKNCI